MGTGYEKKTMSRCLRLQAYQICSAVLWHPFDPSVRPSILPHLIPFSSILSFVLEMSSCSKEARESEMGLAPLAAHFDYIVGLCAARRVECVCWNQPSEYTHVATEPLPIQLCRTWAWHTASQLASSEAYTRRFPPHTLHGLIHTHIHTRTHTRALAHSLHTLTPLWDCSLHLPLECCMEITIYTHCCNIIFAQPNRMQLKWQFFPLLSLYLSLPLSLSCHIVGRVAGAPRLAPVGSLPSFITRVHWPWQLYAVACNCH